MKLKYIFIIIPLFILSLSAIEHLHNPLTNDCNISSISSPVIHGSLPFDINCFQEQSAYSVQNTQTIIPTENPDRVTYQPGFYYEPIPESVKEYIYGKSYKSDCTIPYEDLSYLTVQYYDFNNTIQSGEIICNVAIVQDLVEIFYELYLNEYPIESIHLIDDYNADDELSMEANNTSCFNYRTVSGKKALSKHALGLAIDINPFYNPYVVHTSSNGISITPVGSEAYADRGMDFPHKITQDDLCYKLFISHGFTWGGNWKSCKDYQHFEKNIS